MSTAGIPLLVRNVGGVSEFRAVLEPGVNVLRGRNGAGKTSTHRAVARACGADVPLELKDGIAARVGGLVEMPGVQVVVRSVVRTTGEADVALADVGALADLIDPGIKDEDAANLARLRALAALVPMPVTPEAVLDLAGHDVELAEAAEAEIRRTRVRSLLVAGDKVRRCAYEIARTRETECERLQGVVETRSAEASDIVGQIGKVSPLTAAEARGAMAAAAAEHRELSMLRAQSVELEAHKAEIRAELGSRPDEHAADVAILDAEAERSAAGLALEEARQALAAAMVRSNRADHMVSLAHTDRRNVEKAQAEWGRKAEILARPSTGPSAEDVEAAQKRLDTAVKAAEVAEASDRYRAARAAVAEASGEHLRLGELAAAARATGAAVWERLGVLMADSPASDLAVVDGRLQARVDGEWRDFAARCSEGQRTTAALRIAVRAYPGRVIPLDGRFWVALDPAAKHEFHQRAIAEGVYIVTEEPAEGDLRMEGAA